MMKSLRHLIPAAALLSILLFGSTQAAPPPAVSILMRTPVTRWDWGLFRLESSLREEMHGELEVTAKLPGERQLTFAPDDVLVNYDPQSSRITVRADYETKTDQLSDSTVRDLCKKAIGKLRQFFFVSPETGSRIGSYSSFNTWFRIDDFGNDMRASEVGSYIEGITILRVTEARLGRYSDGKEKMSGFECQGPLLSTSVAFRPW